MPQSFTILFLKNHDWKDSRRDPSPNAQIPDFTIVPMSQVCKELGLSPRQVIEAFRAWLKDKRPDRSHYKIGVELTTRGEEREIYIQIEYRPDVYYLDGSIHLAKQWGTQGQIRTAYERGHFTYSLEPVITGFPFIIED